MIEEKLYEIEGSGYLFYVVANDFGEAEKIANEVSINKIYTITLKGKVYRPKTKTVTIDI